MGSTTKKGNLFENQVFSIIQRLVKEDKFGVSPTTSVVKQKEKYFSVARDGDIIFDITIEIFRVLDAPTFSTLYVIECKNIERKVTVDDVEEFSMKLSQVGADNTKGLIVSTNGFQRGAYNFAKSRRIALAKMNKSNQLNRDYSPAG